MKKKPTKDIVVSMRVLSKMPLEQRRESLVLARMAEYHKNYHDIARRHRFTSWRLSRAVQGKATWTPRIVKALQNDLNLNLSAFLTDKEADKYRRKQSHH